VNEVNDKGHFPTLYIFHSSREDFMENGSLGSLHSLKGIFKLVNYKPECQIVVVFSVQVSFGVLRLTTASGNG
jgi:hypothetical protein